MNLNNPGSENRHQDKASECGEITYNECMFSPKFSNIKKNQTSFREKKRRVYTTRETVLKLNLIVSPQNDLVAVFKILQLPNRYIRYYSILLRMSDRSESTKLSRGINWLNKYFRHQVLLS